MCICTFSLTSRNVLLKKRKIKEKVKRVGKRKKERKGKKRGVEIPRLALEGQRGGGSPATGPRASTK
jgi:hypothetical protein